MNIALTRRDNQLERERERKRDYTSAMFKGSGAHNVYFTSATFAVSTLNPH